jgi:CHAT domain-containing protein
LAEDDLRAGINEGEAQREKITDDALGASYFDQLRSLYDGMIRFQILRQHNPTLGFEYAERARARGLLSAVSATDAATHVMVSNFVGQALSGTVIAEQLPPDVVLVEYSVQKDRLFAWVVTARSLEEVEISVAADPLEREILRFRRSLASSDSSAALESSSMIFDWIIRPLLAKVSNGQAWIIVPDKFLNLIPFAGLYDTETKRFFVETWRVASSPSASLYVKALQRHRQIQSGASAPALILGSPAFNTNALPDLPLLHGSEREARTVAKLWGADLLLGPAASRSAFLHKATKYGLIHLASHAWVNNAHPLLSALALAPDESSKDGILYARDIYGLKFERTRLVILAGCDTSAGQISESEGVANLVRPFIAAGVPVVLASLWSMHDSDSVELFVSFHRNLNLGFDIISSLALAQKNFIHRGKSIETWAGLQLVGGVSLTGSTRRE